MQERWPEIPCDASRMTLDLARGYFLDGKPDRRRKDV
jgi:hypothetical protein